MNKNQINKLANFARVVGYLESLSEQDSARFADGLVLAAFFSGYNRNDLTPEDLLDLFDRARELMICYN